MPAADYRPATLPSRTRRPAGASSGTGLGSLAITDAGDRREVQEIQPVATDHDLVAVGQRAPLDALAVDEHAIQAAVIEDPQPVRLAHDQRVPARDGRIVEADVRGEAPPDPRPLALERVRDHILLVVAVGEVLARVGEPLAELIEPAAIV